MATYPIAHGAVEETCLSRCRPGTPLLVVMADGSERRIEPTQNPAMYVRRRSWLRDIIDRETGEVLVPASEWSEAWADLSVWPADTL